MPPRAFSLIRFAESCAVLLVRSSFHLYFFVTPKGGTCVQPGVTIGNGPSGRHWHSVALKTTARAPWSGG